MVIGAGYSFKFGKLNLPVNIAYVPSMNKTYEGHLYSEIPVDPDGIPNSGDEYLEYIDTEYSVTHPTGARVSIMVGFNLSK